MIVNEFELKDPSQILAKIPLRYYLDYLLKSK
jgi:hypothetical protein